MRFAAVEDMGLNIGKHLSNKEATEMEVIIASNAVEDDTRRETYTIALKKYICEISACIGYDLSGLDNIYCSASEADFYSDVRSIQAEKGVSDGVTDAGYYRAVGKTISYVVDGTRRSSIVLSDQIWCSIVLHIFSSVPSEENYVPLSNYIVAHELGHAIDNLLRTQNDANEEPSRLDYRALSRYYSTILIGDYFACLFSAKALERAVLDGMIRELAKDKENFRIEAQQRLDRHRSGDCDLHEIAQGTSGSVWAILLKFAKIVGSIHGGCDIGMDTIIWAGATETTRTLLATVESILRESASAYPSIDITDNLSNAWRQLSISFGFNFEQDEMDRTFVFFNEDATLVW